jgi:hypothetical protein
VDTSNLTICRRVFPTSLSLHIFVKEKASWFEVPDGEERRVEHEKEFQTKIDMFLKSKDKGGKKGNVTAA